MENILITGGAGTLGTEMIRQLKANVTILTRHEESLVNIKRNFPKVNCILGDICDYKTMKEATKGIDMIYHLAALKHISLCEKNPTEAMRVNVYGTLNVIKAALKNDCKMVFMSSDKAEDPISVYGCSKKLGELFSLNNGFMVVRSGNIFASSGSVIPLWIDQVKNGKDMTITDSRMTRFFIKVQDLAFYIINIDYDSDAVKIPITSSYKIFDIAHEIGKRYSPDGNYELNVCGNINNEKIHETLGNKSSADCLRPAKELFE